MNGIVETVGSLIDNQRQQFNSVLSVKTINFDREASYAKQILGDSSSYLHKVALSNKTSLVNAVNNVAAIGISLNPASKLAYLVPRKGAICLDISYMGIIHIAMASQAIFWAQAKIVRENDTFTLNGVDQPPTHTYNPFSKDRGEVVGCYVVVKTAEGDYLTNSMTIDEICAIRDRSEAWKSHLKNKTTCPWVTDFAEMAKKTVVKNASKYWPRKEQLDGVIHYLNDPETEGIDFAKDITPPKTVLDDVKTGNPALIDDDLSLMTAEEQDQIRKVAINIGELLDEGFEWEAFDRYEENPNMQFRSALWSCLGNRRHDVNGKQILCRSTLKKLKEARDKGERPEGGD